MATGKGGLLLIYEILNGILNNPVQDFSLFHDGNVYCDGSVFLVMIFTAVFVLENI